MTIMAERFAARLISVCLDASGVGLPRKRLDQRILFDSAALCLDPEVLYSEKDINEALKCWINDVARNVAIDHVTIRRYLVDEGLLLRDKAGHAYRLNLNPLQDLFASTHMALDPFTIVDEAVMARKARKSLYLALGQ